MFSDTPEQKHTGCSVSNQIFCEPNYISKEMFSNNVLTFDCWGGGGNIFRTLTMLKKKKTFY